MTPHQKYVICVLVVVAVVIMCCGCWGFTAVEGVR